MAKINPQYLLRYDLRMEADSEDAEIMVYGEIVQERWDKDSPDLSAKDFDSMLKDAKARGAKRLNLRINSPGGSVYQAIAMRTMLMSSGLDLTVDIDGMCASSATLLTCVPGAKVRMHSGSMFMIHNPTSIVMGDARDMQHEADVLHKIEGDFANIYAQRSGNTPEDIRTLMDDETWFTASDAMDYGFADEYVEDGEAVASVSAADLQTMKTIYAHVPENIRQTEVSNDSALAAAAESTEIQNNNEEVRGMDIQNYTAEQLSAENPDLCASIAAAAVEAERKRIQEIDDLTMPGYADMAARAKADGTSAMDFYKQVVRAQKEKGEKFMLQRQLETEPAGTVGNGGPTHSEEQAEEERAIKDIAEYARLYNSESGGMF